MTASLLASPAWSIDFSKKIKEIRIEGTVRADENTVRFYINSKPGGRYNVDTIQKDIRKIFKLGFFDDIKLDVTETPEGLTLTFIFTEKPFVRNIIITGVEEIKEDVLKLKIKTKNGTFFRQDHIPWDELKIKQAYRNKGFFFSQVHTVVHKLGENQVDVEYIVDEGKKIVIGRINFRGNKAFSDRTIKGQIETKTANWGSFFSDNGAYKKDVLKTDVLRVESYYHDHGYIKVKVGDPQVEIDRENQIINIDFPIFEGEQYKVGDITVQGDSVYTSEELSRTIRLAKGDVFNRSMFREDMFKISDLYSQKGYAFANVAPDLDIDEKNRTVDVKVNIKRGQKVYIGKITISGNDKTRDRVIRREFLLQEGELFNSAKLRRSRERINNLGFFDSVEMEQRSGREPDLVDLHIKLVERETGQFSFAAGYSSVEYLVLEAQLKWSNLMGKGQTFSLSANMSDRRHDFTISFTEPSLFDRKLSAGLDLYNKEYEYQAFTSLNVGGSIRFGRGIGEYTWGRIGYKFENNDVTILDREAASAYLLAQEGHKITGAIFPSVVYDTRNDPYSPTSGRRLKAYLEVAGAGGEEKFYKLTGEYSEYVGLWLDFVGLLHAKIGRADGYDGKGLPIYERFFMGGPRSLRGFNFEEVGPFDENGEAIGGEALLQFNFELQYRFTRYFRGFFFYDRGNVYGRDDVLGNSTDQYYDLANMRHSWGFGIHFFSPMGPISIIYGFKLDQRENETPNEFHFTIGGAF